MVNYRSLSLMLMILAVWFTLESCNDQSSPYVDYLIKVDSIHLPDTVTSGIPFNIEFFGTVGFDGCHSFKIFNQEYADQNFSIEAWGTYDNTTRECPAEMVSLDGTKYPMVIPVPGSYNLYILNPDGYLGARIIAR